MTNELNMKYKKICKKSDYDPDEDEKKKESKVPYAEIGASL